MKKIKAALLGATGVVGQQFIRLLVDHPNFDLDVLAASEKSAGKRYEEAVRWIVGSDIPDAIKEKPILDIDAKAFIKKDIRIAFSALPASIALVAEKELASEGIAVFSNASAYRMEKDVPILEPEVNPDHLSLVENQRKKHEGFIVTNSNCTASGLVLGLKPLAPFGIRYVTMTSYQALSGAGLPGVPSLEGIGNVIPFIEDEEEKVESETKKMLGSFSTEGIKDASFEVNASCARVPVHDGHLESIIVELEEEATIEDVGNAFREFSGMPQKLGLPTAPRSPIIVRNEENRPQPLLDLYAGEPARAQGMAVSVGRIRKKGGRIRFYLLVHNTIRGAAGASILNAEFAVSQKHIK